VLGIAEGGAGEAKSTLRGVDGLDTMLLDVFFPRSLDGDDLQLPVSLNEALGEPYDARLSLLLVGVTRALSPMLDPE